MRSGLGNTCPVAPLTLHRGVLCFICSIKGPPKQGFESELSDPCRMRLKGMIFWNEFLQTLSVPCQKRPIKIFKF